MSILHITPEEGAALMLTGLEAHMARWTDRRRAIGTTFSGSQDDVSHWARTGIVKSPGVLVTSPENAAWAVNHMSENAAWRRAVMAIVTAHPNVRVVKRSKAGAVLLYRYV